MKEAKDIKVYSKTQNGNPLRGVLYNALKDIISVLDAERGSLFLFDSKQNELVLDSFFSRGNPPINGLRKKIGEGISGKVVEIKMPVLVKNIDVDPRFKKNGSVAKYNTGSFIAIPLFAAKGDLLGLINIADKSNKEPFTEKDLEFAVAVSKYICIVLEDLLHFSKLVHEREDLNKQKALLEKYASVGKLAAGVVHEINNPLDGVIRYTNILLEQSDNSSSTREYLLEVKKGLGRIENITKSLLDFSHLVSSDTLKNRRYVDVHQVIDESLDTLKSKLNGNIAISKRYKKSLPRILDLGLQYVVINLIRNALEAMTHKGKLEISTNMKNAIMMISFKDTGLGIPEEIRGHIFDAFFTTKSIDKGTGLGLSICREIVNKYEGKIEVSSKSGKGSTFTICIPKKYLENAKSK